MIHGHRRHRWVPDPFPLIVAGLIVGIICLSLIAGATAAWACIR